MQRTSSLRDGQRGWTITPKELWPLWLKAAAILFLIDIFWLATGGIFGRRMIELIQGRPLNLRWFSAGFVYLLLAYMMLEATSYRQAFAFGVCIYGVFEFTNLAVFTGYDWLFAVAETVWGGVLLAFGRYLLQAF